jgi:hypothetical protein
MASITSADPELRDRGGSGLGGRSGWWIEFTRIVVSQGFIDFQQHGAAVRDA